MYTTSLLALTALLSRALAAPNAPQLEKRVIATSSCNHDNLYRSFVDPRTSVSASSFCSTYIRSTAASTATTTVTVSPPKAKRDVEEKRELGATTYPASRLSSACSCILTAQPTPTTVTTTTTVTVSTSSAPAGCTNPSTIVKNGDFESGLAPWSVTQVSPAGPYYTQYITQGVQGPGYKSDNAFTVTDDAASSYFELDLAQTLQVCAGQKYSFSAEFYMTDSHNTPSKETYLQIYVDGTQVATSTFAQGQGPPVVWFPLTGKFTAGSNAPVVTAKFIATNIVGVTWGLDNVVITPA